MNISGIVAIAVEKNGRNYVFNIPMGSPYEEAIDACLDVIGDLKQMKKDSTTQQVVEKTEQEAAPSTPVEAELVS